MNPLPSALLQGASNFRDVGGYHNADGRRVRQGQVFRSDHLAGLTPEDLARLASLGISHSLDFRGAAEYTATPYAIPGVQRLALTIEPSVIARMQALVVQGIVPTTEETVALMQETYRDFVNHNAGTFGRFLKHLLEQPTPQVFHCTAGKDRTGVAAMLLLSALGVEEEVIHHDYLATNRLWRRDAEVSAGLPPVVADTLLSVQPAFLEAAYEAIHTGWGSIDAYLHQQLGLDDARMAVLRARLVE